MSLMLNQILFSDSQKDLYFNSSPYQGFAIYRPYAQKLATMD